MDSNIPLGRFLEHDEGERAILFKSRVNVDVVPSPRGQPVSKPINQAECKLQCSVSKFLEDSITELTERIDKLQGEVTRSPNQRSNGGTLWTCQYCRSMTTYCGSVGESHLGDIVLIAEGLGVGAGGLHAREEL